jgi:hypothetical protein
VSGWSARNAAVALALLALGRRQVGGTAPA